MTKNVNFDIKELEIAKQNKYVIAIGRYAVDERGKEDVMTKEVEQRQRIVELEHANQALRNALTEAEQRGNDIYAEYQALVYSIRNSPTEHDLLALKGRIVKLEKLLDEEVTGWRFKMHGHDHDAKREEAIAHRA